MNEYTYIIFDHKGKRLGKIEFGKRMYEYILHGICGRVCYPSLQT